MALILKYDADFFFLFAETVTYWGHMKKVDVSSALANMNTILSEKIQDTRKALKRINLFKSVQT